MFGRPEVCFAASTASIELLEMVATIKASFSIFNFNKDSRSSSGLTTNFFKFGQERLHNFRFFLMQVAGFCEVVVEVIELSLGAVRLGFHIGRPGKTTGAETCDQFPLA